MAPATEVALTMPCPSRSRAAGYSDKDKGFQLVRYYGWYSNKRRGMRAKSKKCEAACEFLSAYQAPKVPSKKWRELIRKVWEIDPLICPACGGEMKVMALINERVVIEKILKHLKLWSESVPDRSRASPPSDTNIIYEPFYDDIQRNSEERIVG